MRYLLKCIVLITAGEEHLFSHEAYKISFAKSVSSFFAQKGY